MMLGLLKKGVSGNNLYVYLIDRMRTEVCYGKPQMKDAGGCLLAD